MSFKVGVSKVRGILLTAFLVIFAFSGGYFFGVNGYKTEVNKALQVKINREIPPDKNVDFSLFWQVWDTVSAKYYDKTKVVPSEMVYGAIEGMVASLGDPYTMFLPPKENKVVNEDLSGTFEGVGMQLGYKDGKLAVVSPVTDSPAEKAGVKAGDFVVRIKDDGKGIDVGTSGLSLPQAVQYIRGKAGTHVSITFVRDGNPEPIVVDLIRAKLTVPSVNLKFVGKNNNIADIKVTKFDSETPGQWDKAVSQILQKGGVTGIIIDLRNNPGGYLQDAIDMASDFVPVGTTVVMEQHGDGSKKEYKSEKLGRLEKYNVVVIVNGGSASASEIFAGALRDLRHFKLLGEKSFGKGTVQEPINIEGGSGIHITTAKWLTPAGTWVHGKGLEPDLTIVAKASDSADVQLDAAMKLFN